MASLPTAKFTPKYSAEIKRIAEKTAKRRTQHQRFIDTARELGCNEDEATFSETLKRFAKR